jgi:DNA-binding NarL/FixJ family response regulator
LIALVRQAKSNKEIAYELSLTVGSVKEYMHRVFRKLGVRSRTELALSTFDQHF